MSMICDRGYGVEVSSNVDAVFMQTPNAELQAKIAAGVPAPAVTVPNGTPTAA